RGSACSPFCLFTRSAPSAPPSLSLHAALPISRAGDEDGELLGAPGAQLLHERGQVRLVGLLDRLANADGLLEGEGHRVLVGAAQDRKSTRLNSSHVKISYAVFCLNKNRCGTLT